MTEIATLVAQSLVQFAPTTNHYQCSDGTYLLVSIPDYDAILEGTFGKIPVRRSHLPQRADIFLADENATVLDTNGDPADGMTPLMQIDGCTSFAEALTEAGYSLQ